MYLWILVLYIKDTDIPFGLECINTIQRIGIKYLISKDYESEYKQVISTLEYDNALVAQASLLNSLMKYKVVDQQHINYVAEKIRKRWD